MKDREVIPFVKMHGIGNDYIYIDALRGETPVFLEESRLPDLSKKISDRHFGVGSDGLILILPSDIADFRMRIFNADGSEAKMCGNGIRCVGKYVRDLGFTDKDVITVQ
ncbi:MAG: diaminopimelate epimerase, partial [Muribaculaceae bacterium]|nr:diaminopimelate epimerase [Muribaculaceae bacterium]